MRRMAGAQVYHTRTRRLAADGKSTDSRMLAIRDGRGDHLIAFYDPATDAETLFDPPIPTLSADLAVGSTWEATGQRIGTQGTIDYRYSGKVIERGEHQNSAGKFQDTLKVETRLALSQEGKTLYDRVSNYWLAPGVGGVSSESLDGEGKLESRTVMLSAAKRPLPEAALPASASSAERPALGHDPAQWELSRFASTRTANDNSESSIPPVWIPTNPPTLLAARYGGPLMAFDATDPGKPPLWSFQAGATIYGSPVHDPASGRIYFGAADKRLYALDARGLFLWSFATGDNIVTRPVVAGDVVIFASEDRTVYSVDAATGVERWHREVGGAVVSSPALVDGLVLFGSDDGGVYALDVKTGEPKWRFPANAPVEAPIVVAGGRIFAGTHRGDLFAIDPATRKAIWSAEAGGELRTAPLVAGNVLYIVNGNARLVAYDAATGRRLWSSEEKDYVGPPVLAGETLIVGSENGDVHRVDLSGRRQGEPWLAANASSPSDGAPALRLGGVEGGGAVWFADTRSVVRRLGPAAVGPVALRAAWMLPFMQEPLTPNFLNIAPIAYGEQALVVNGGRDIFLLDPANGKGRHVGTFGEAGAPAIEPAVAGDTLLASAGTMLYATSLANGSARWKFDGKDPAAQPPTAAGDTAFWLTQHYEPPVDGKARPLKGMLHALDLATGAVRWQRPLSGFAGIGAALVSGSMLLTSAPTAAFDLATGEPRWQAQLDDMPIGGGALNDAGDTLYVGTVSNEEARASIAAIRTADGSVLWQRTIGDTALNTFERPWVSGEALVVPLSSGEVIGIAAADGAELWRHKPGRPRFGGITVAAGHVWFTQNDGRVVALEAKSGRVAARLALDRDISNIHAFAPRPLVLGGRVIVPLGMLLLGVAVPGTGNATTPQPEEAQR
jgi:outer membrane protein assembly factor BamB